MLQNTAPCSSGSQKLTWPCKMRVSNLGQRQSVCFDRNCSRGRWSFKKIHTGPTKDFPTKDLEHYYRPISDWHYIISNLSSRASSPGHLAGEGKRQLQFLATELLGNFQGWFEQLVSRCALAVLWLCYHSWKKLQAQVDGKTVLGEAQSPRTF